MSSVIEMLQDERLTLVDRIRRSQSALSANELASLLGCTSCAIQAKAKRKKIPSYCAFGSVRFDPVLIADWVERSGGA
jgi:predicted DNA-binding transcriptional regulator AlpA